MNRKFKNNNASIGLWTLLSIGLLIFLIYSFTDDVTLFGHSLKKGSFKEVLTKEIDKDPLLDINNNGTNNEIITAEVDTTIKTILIFGDSMSVLLCRRMAEYGEQNGYKIIAITWDGSTTIKWGNENKLDDAIREYNPDFIIACLGSNELFLKNYDAKANDVKSVIKKFGNIPFIWVGPPNWKEDQGFDPMMIKTLPKGTYFVSTGIELPRGKDKIHPTPAGGVTWTDSLMRWIPKSAHPFLSKKPNDNIKNTNFILHYFSMKGNKEEKPKEDLLPNVEPAETEEVTKNEEEKESTSLPSNTPEEEPQE